MNHTTTVSTSVNTNFHMDASNNETSTSLELTKQLAQIKLNSMKIPKRQPTIICEDIIDDDFCDDDDDDNEEDTFSSMTEPNDVAVDGDKVVRSASTASLTVPVVSETDEKVEKRRPPLPASQSDYYSAQ